MPFLSDEDFAKFKPQPKPKEPEAPEEEPEDTSIFADKPLIKGKPLVRKSAVGRWLRGDPRGYQITQKKRPERVKLREDWFGHSEYVGPKKIKRVIKKKEGEIYKSKTKQEKTRLSREVKLLKKMGGKHL